MFIAYLLSPVFVRFQFTGVCTYAPGSFLPPYRVGIWPCIQFGGLCPCQNPRSVSFSNRMSRFGPDTENATESRESQSSTDDEGDTSLGGRRVRDADADLPRRDRSPQSSRPRVSAVVPASAALGFLFRSPKVLLCGNSTCSRPVYPGYLFCGLRCGRLVCPLFLV